MKVLALVSGGKDSCYAMMKCQQYGHEIVALANLMPVDDTQDELDSYMYQTVGHQIVISYAQCMGIPLFRRRILGSTRHHALSYNTTPGDEVEDMFILLEEVKRRIPSISAVSSGAIASDYQRLRVESVCSRLGLVSLAYLWKQDQSLLLQEMIRSGIIAITVKVAAIGLNPSKHLGKEIKDLELHLHKLKELYGINVCGEGGEYETLTLDCPLFKNARIVLDQSQVILHSSDQIAPVGVLHPVEYHLERKLSSSSAIADEKSNMLPVGESTSVYEVAGDCQDFLETKSLKNGFISDLGLELHKEIHISKSGKDDTFSLACWLPDSSESSGLQEDLKAALTRLELLLIEYNHSWENVLYIHLYIDNMDNFAVANEEYVKFITQVKCQFGVPSRSTIELPLSQVGLGGAYIEALVSNDINKNVLHVQSISEWAPSCIGPYSQATLHKDILYMAGQLGLDPPTMSLCNQGPLFEFEQALKNSEAVAKSFNCSVSTSSIALTIYCSVSLKSSDRIAIENQKDVSLAQMKLGSNSGSRFNKFLVSDPVVLFILVPDLPKRALVEVKPLLYTGENVEASTIAGTQDLSTRQEYWGFRQQNWHNDCLQKCIVSGRICTAGLSITPEIATRIYNEGNDLGNDDDSQSKTYNEKNITRLAEFCIYLLDRVLVEGDFSWADVTNLRIYFTSSLPIGHKSLSTIFANAFKQFGEMSGRTDTSKNPFFNVVPVLGAGRLATSMNDIITCEIFATK